MDIRKYINIVESLSRSGYKEVEYVCINRSIDGSTPPQNMKNLYAALCKTEGVLVYRQDFIEEADHIAVAAIPYYHPANLRTLKGMGKQHGVAVDVVNEMSNFAMDEILAGTYPNLIDAVIVHSADRIQHIKGPEWSVAHQNWSGYPYDDDATNPYDE